MSLVRGRAMRSPRGHELTAVVDDLRDRRSDAERIWAGGTDLLVQGRPGRCSSASPATPTPAGRTTRTITSG
ncbi:MULTISPECIES: hypothetical protein [Nonomuraea]|uniref:Uncharacterized protein n=1 Tax=Nonomuraea ferruginea TaxID=46174 RepID=A0ABT4SSI3_9ACTN|nr:hypothetical protein [Nonomuraea ferruginea]MDA0640231.1 hypothetical protein [Nonomuraea ferruginea]